MKLKDLTKIFSYSTVLELSLGVLPCFNEIPEIKVDNIIDYKDGDQGKYAIQEHERGLSEEQAKKGTREGDSISIHSDLRMQRLTPEKDEIAEGISLFTPGNQTQENKLKLMQTDNTVRAQFSIKPFEPVDSLNLGDKENDIYPPGEEGSTEKTWSRYVKIDSGDWIAGVQDQHYKEFYFFGELLQGRYILTFAPVGDKEERVWLFGKPEKQNMDSSTAQTVIDSKLKTKSDKGKILKKVSVDRKFSKVDEYKRIVYGEVYIPYNPEDPTTVDTQGDYMLAEDIEEMAHDFLMNAILNQSRDMDTQHDFIGGKAVPVESFIVRPGDPDFYVGAWVIAAKILDERVWEDILAGNFTGYSLAGFGQEVTEE